ncbi:MAG TPA: hypothetical protein VF375_06545 [Candidatus Limnocylindrales bacterium]
MKTPKQVLGTSSSGPKLHKSHLIGKDGRLDPVLQFQLVQQSGHMRLCRGIPDHERLGDMGVREALRNQLEDLRFPVGELIQPGLNPRLGRPLLT